MTTKRWAVIFRSGARQTLLVPEETGDFLEQITTVLAASKGSSSYLKFPGAIIDVRQIACAAAELPKTDDGEAAP